jgi:hypothetical protein
LADCRFEDGHKSHNKPESRSDMSAEMEAKAVEPKGSQIQKHGSKEEQD